MRKKIMIWLGMVLCVAFVSCGGGSGDSGITPEGENTFTNGGVTLETAVTGTDTRTVEVTDEDGNSVLTLEVSTTGVTMSAPGQTDATMTFREPLASAPSEYCAKRMAIFAAGIMTVDASLSSRPDSPGCDWFPDTQCTLGCCADHDQCYGANNCGASSWIWGFGSDACKNCNNIAYDCIAAACAGVTESFTENNCYDAKCNKYYDCPPDYNSCDCVDICEEEAITVPTTCGDGQCTDDESLETCWMDCGFGTSESECCVDHDFPNETGSECGVEGVYTCCCASGYACGWHVGDTVSPNTCQVSND